VSHSLLSGVARRGYQPIEELVALGSDSRTVQICLSPKKDRIDSVLLWLHTTKTGPWEARVGQLRIVSSRCPAQE
jgi:hypothetical protein